MRKRVGLLIGLFAWALCLSAQKAYKFRVQLRDKAVTAYSLDRPEEYLSERALDRRARQGLTIDSTDLPVCRPYIRRLVQQGGKLVVSSKWNNTVVMEVPNEGIAEAFKDNPFVVDVLKVWEEPDSIIPRDKNRKKIVKNEWEKLSDYYGASAAQVRIHHGDSLHQAGFRGKGMQIAVIDAGFYNADVISFFKSISLLGVRDFVNPHSDIFGEHSHGLKVLSCLAANAPHVMVGTAPEASYWLLRSEDNDTEQLVEEDYWAAAIEFADSVGVDVVNTSLGYHEFDEPFNNYEYKDLDGRTSLMSASASLAADKGILVVCSAGNSGISRWKKITPPADAFHVLAVGAVDQFGLNADFSSVGNTADNRVKPDVMAVGVRTGVSAENGNVSYANGTSFASPVFCGLAACLWQACPWLTVPQLIEVVHRSSDRIAYPDNIFGYGVCDIWQAYRLALQLKPE